MTRRRRNWIAGLIGLLAIFVVLLVPALVRPAEDWRIDTPALERDVLTTERFLTQGSCASRMFANRFITLHPAGVADFEELMGGPFDADAFRSVPHWVVMGMIAANSKRTRQPSSRASSHADSSAAETSRAARRLYESLGFRARGTEPRALRDDGAEYDETHRVLFLDSKGRA